ncbi:MAG: hypothetical protein Q7S87_09760 [Agitococcus sp.]|nr:hypothetical protein [Agitococcus sp.]MDO9177100.1 hypothetical protein [Agitococcus sp.]
MKLAPILSLEHHVLAIKSRLTLAFINQMSAPVLLDRFTHVTSEELKTLICNISIKQPEIALAAVELQWIWEAGAGQEYQRLFLEKLESQGHLSRFYSLLLDINNGEVNVLTDASAPQAEVA